MWDWLPFLVGLLAGLAAMWLFDWWFYGRRLPNITDLSALQKQLAEAEDEKQQLEDKLKTAHNSLESTGKELVSARADAKLAAAETAELAKKLDVTNNSLDATKLETERLKIQLQYAAQSTPAPQLRQRDDLQRVVGIGPKYERLLNEAGIRTFQALANSDSARVIEIIQPEEWQTIDAESWIEQAGQLLGDG